MKVKKLEKAFEKLVKREIDSDGFVRIDTVVIDRQTEEITLTVAVGQAYADSDGSWCEIIELTYPDGESVEFVKGMLYTKLRKLI
jgi:hypothetical protein